MVVKVLFYYIAGYIRITVEGYFIERFINICTQKNILLWNTKTIGTTIMKTNISISDFRKLHVIDKKTKCRIKIKEKKGLPFFFERYKKRKILAILLVILIATMIIISNFVWNIQIECDGEINKDEIQAILEKNGLKIGALKEELDTSKIARSIRYEREDIAWVGVSFKGTNAIVELIKAEQKPEIIQENEYCSIISDKEGIITKINVQNGTAAVKVGDLIKNGTTLVNGWLQGKYTGIRYVHAMADIEAKVWYSQKRRVYKTQNIEVSTGRQEKKYGLKLNNFEINFYKTLSKFENYDTIIETKKIKLFSDFYIPIELKTIQNYEKEKQMVTYTLEELKENNISQMEKEIEQEIGQKENIVNKQINFNEQDTYVDIEIIYEVIESIGTKEKIVF